LFLRVQKPPHVPSSDGDEVAAVQIGIKRRDVCLPIRVKASCAARKYDISGSLVFLRPTSARSLTSFGAAFCTLLLATSGLAQDGYPTKPIQLFSPLPAGGSTDVATRAWMACASQEKLAGQPFVLQNRPGANGVIAANLMRQRPKDGYSLMVAGMSQTTITPFTFRRMPYDPQKDFEGAAIFGTTTFTMVAGFRTGIKSIRDLQAYAKSQAKGINLGIPGMASPGHLMSAALADKLGIDATLIPLGTEANGLVALNSGDVSAMIFVTGSIMPHIAAGRVVPLMTFTEQRLPQLPDVPTVTEAIGDASLARLGWLGISMRAGGPKHVVRAVERWTKSCLETEEFQQALRNALFTPRFVSAEEFKEVVRRDVAFWKPWIQKLGIQTE
jgi:tripartite-type tricarboxylate transporter receptor subunit TctC